MLSTLHSLLSNILFVILVIEQLIEFINPYCYLLQDVPPLDAPELLAYLVKQSGPFLDQLGVKRGNKVALPSIPIQ